MTYNPRFYTKRGFLNAYGIACGYVDVAYDPSREDPTEHTIRLWHEGGCVYHVRGHDHASGERTAPWETFETLTAARRHFMAEARRLGMYHAKPNRGN